jgi:hypothetical protein
MLARAGRITRINDGIDHCDTAGQLVIGAITGLHSRRNPLFTTV